jgi:signal transduction histidine kinase
MHPSIHEFFEQSPEALLLCHPQETGAGYAIYAMNQRARVLLGGNGQLKESIPLSQIITSKILLEAIENAFSTHTRQSGCLEPNSLPVGSASLSFTVDRLATAVLIQLHKDSDGHLLQALGEHVLATDLTCAVVFEAVRDRDGSVKDLRLMFQNEAARQNPYLGIPAQPGVLITQWYPNSRALGFFERYVEVIETGVPFAGEKYYPDKNYNYHVAASKYDDGVIISYDNLTDKLLAERRVKEQYQLLEGILDSSENIIFVADAVREDDGTIVDFRISKGNKNAMDAFQQTFGIDVTGMSIRTLVGGKPELFDEAVGIMETGKPMVLEQRYEPTSGKWFKVSIHRLDNGLVLTYVDITPMQTALLEAKHQTELLQTVLDSSINGLYAMEIMRNEAGRIADFRIVMVNQAGLKLTAHAYEEVVGNTYLSLFPMVKEMGLFDEFTEAIENAAPFRREVGFAVPDDPDLRWFDLSLSQTGAGMIILTFIDTTERILLAQKQEALLEKLRKSNQDLERFAYIASHDLSEPTRKINAFSEMLVSQYAAQLPKGGLDLVGRMQSASARMQELVDGILAFSRFSSQQEEHHTISVRPIFTNILADLDAVISEKRATIDIGDMPKVRGNQVQLRQLFQNLISNALKFTKDSTAPHIRIEAGPATPEEIKEAVQNTGRRWLAIRVHDNGIGFDVSQRTRIFELFARLHGRSQYPGSGLGLAICKRIAELHHGGIAVHSVPGQGTTFSVVLPALG